MTSNGFNNPVELPSIGEINEMDKQHENAIQSIEVISSSPDNNNYYNDYVKCHYAPLDIIYALNPRDN